MGFPGARQAGDDDKLAREDFSIIPRERRSQAGLTGIVREGKIFALTQCVLKLETLEQTLDDLGTSCKNLYRLVME